LVEGYGKIKNISSTSYLEGELSPSKMSGVNIQLSIHISRMIEIIHIIRNGGYNNKYQNYDKQQKMETTIIVNLTTIIVNLLYHIDMFSSHVDIKCLFTK